MKKQLGQAHGIDKCVPQRPDGNLVLYCPACPEPGFNINAIQTPLPQWARYGSLTGLHQHLTVFSSYRHLLQLQRTLDGNFQLNRMKKNSDPDDVSLCKGKGHFPEHGVLERYLAGIKYKDEACYKFLLPSQN
jgi:hypothetical protein